MTSENPASLNSHLGEEVRGTPEFLEMKLRAEAAEAKLRRIYNTPIWKITKPVRKIYARLLKTLSNRKEKDYIFKPESNNGKSVLELSSGKISIESQNADLKNSSIAIVAHFSNSPELSTSLKKYLNSLIEYGFSVILSSACTAHSALELDESLKEKITILRKPNVGYDFGSWAVALETFPEIFDAQELILTNDSLIGPFEDFADIFSKLRNSDFDITGITDNPQLQYHIQSYFMHFKQKAITNTNLQLLLKSIVHLELKNDVILKYELGLTRVAQLSGLFVGAIFPWNLVVSPGKNPSLAGWSRLLELNFPFLKREAVRLASYSEVKRMSSTIKAKYPSADFAISEIKTI